MAGVIACKKPELSGMKTKNPKTTYYILVKIQR